MVASRMEPNAAASSRGSASARRTTSGSRVRTILTIRASPSGAHHVHPGIMTSMIGKHQRSVHLK
ncbi:hypothetical protein Msi02_25290 [Microbispora siamensis]|uniref:Uncharacterized protein n=1 Tax=Microbispora siamensis TaxID=564413 RepID=A0ABQ4GJW1_9ACTN|nr:hypothetical protein Msi02_25290 [Microbispora siamensis]